MESSDWVFWAAAGVFVLFILIYVCVMILWPEWVGITGKVAKEAERSHREGAAASDDDFITRAQQKHDSSKR